MRDDEETSEFKTDSSFVDLDDDEDVSDRYRNNVLNNGSQSDDSSDGSDLSQDMDASLILDHPIDQYKIRLIEQKTQSKSSSNKPRKAEDSLKASISRLQEGIRAIKYNFSNSKRKEVMITISSDCKSILYHKLS